MSEINTIAKLMVEDGIIGMVLKLVNTEWFFWSYQKDLDYPASQRQQVRQTLLNQPICPNPKCNSTDAMVLINWGAFRCCDCGRGTSDLYDFHKIKDTADGDRL